RLCLAARANVYWPRATLRVARKHLIPRFLDLDGPVAPALRPSTPMSTHSSNAEEGSQQKTSRFEVVLDRKPPFSATDGEDTESSPRRRASDPGPEASVILIAHPSSQALGTRYRLHAKSAVTLGRATTADISLPEVGSLSREHARLTFRSESVLIEDLGSTNGTFVNE